MSYKMKWMVGVIVSLGTLVSDVTYANPLDSLKQKGTLTCGVIDIYEPFGFVDPATRTVTGYDVDVCRGVAKHLGLQVDIKPVSIEARIPALQQKQMDILVAGLAYTSQRAEQVDYSHAYYVSNNVVVTRKDRGYTNLSDLAGKRVSFVKGSITETHLKEAVPTVVTVGYEDTPTAFTALVQGRVEGISQSEEPLSLLVTKLGSKAADYVVLSPPTGREVWGIGVRKNEAELLGAINQALESMEKSGELQAIFDKWLGASTHYQMKRSFTVEPITPN